MKKLLVIPVMFIYLVAVSGVMIHMHYCGMELQSWNLYAKDKGCPEGECGDESEESDDCCKDEVVTAKVSHEQNTVSSFKLKLNTGDWQIAAMPFVYYEIVAVESYSSITGVNCPNAPPGLWEQIPLYKLHSSFTYYG